MEKKILNIKETADFLGVSRPTLYKWIKEGTFIESVHTTENSHTFFSLDAIKRWLATSKK